MGSNPITQQWGERKEISNKPPDVDSTVRRWYPEPVEPLVFAVERKEGRNEKRIDTQRSHTQHLTHLIKPRDPTAKTKQGGRSVVVTRMRMNEWSVHTNCLPPGKSSASRPYFTRYESGGRGTVVYIVDQGFDRQHPVCEACQEHYLCLYSPLEVETQINACSIC